MIIHFISRSVPPFRRSVRKTNGQTDRRIAFLSHLYSHEDVDVAHLKQKQAIQGHNVG